MFLLMPKIMTQMLWSIELFNIFSEWFRSLVYNNVLKENCLFHPNRPSPWDASVDTKLSSSHHFGVRSIVCMS